MKLDILKASRAAQPQSLRLIHLAILSALATARLPEGRLAATIQELMEMTGFKYGSVVEAVLVLHDLGLIHRTPGGRGGRGGNNHRPTRAAIIRKGLEFLKPLSLDLD